MFMNKNYVYSLYQILVLVSFSGGYRLLVAGVGTVGVIADGFWCMFFCVFCGRPIRRG